MVTGLVWSVQSYYLSHAETSTLTPHSLLDTKVMSGANNLNKFVLEAGPDDCIVKCRITRNCKGLDKGRSWTVLVS